MTSKTRLTIFIIINVIILTQITGGPSALQTLESIVVEWENFGEGPTKKKL